MGMRYTFCTSDYTIKWPQWFFWKWADKVHFSLGSDDIIRGAIAAKSQGQLGMMWEGLNEDIQKVIVETAFSVSIEVMYLCTDGEGSHCLTYIGKKSIKEVWFGRTLAMEEIEESMYEEFN